MTACHLLIVSIHAPVWGATTTKGALALGAGVFQSTHPCGVRPCALSRLPPLGVSIHAPVWGATAEDYGKLVTALVSIHAPVWGATCKNPKRYHSGLFQSTHPCGVRPNRFVISSLLQCFNPRTRVGCDIGVWG